MEKVKGCTSCLSFDQGFGAVRVEECKFLAENPVMDEFAVY